ncbi:hypothetical protein ACFXKD_00470 [Nocardiopsis aegyptia]|uniref:hypothetical protein n=1 Tax=Nocardiopsis aegyptia TaxID=220378 RepID=UPI00366F4660
MGHKWIWPTVLGMIALVLAGFSAVPTMLPSLDLGLNEHSQAAGIASLTLTVAALLLAVQSKRSTTVDTDNSPGQAKPKEWSAPVNTISGSVSDTAIQANTAEARARCRDPW